jgi:hypothetical protein
LGFEKAWKAPELKQQTALAQQVEAMKDEYLWKFAAPGGI